MGVAVRADLSVDALKKRAIEPVEERAGPPVALCGEVAREGRDGRILVSTEPLRH